LLQNDVIDDMYWWVMGMGWGGKKAKKLHQPAKSDQGNAPKTLNLKVVGINIHLIIIIYIGFCYN